ncbi:MAG TPA: hypothetical protein VHP38_07925 [Ruminiclostridium sp.]|nr:hypothetical protein [Ruminiclostridium sp.]
MDKKKTRINALLDLLIVILCFTLSGVLYIPFLSMQSSMPAFLEIIYIMLIEFLGSGLAVFIIIHVRKEKLSDYGIHKKNTGASLIAGIILTVIFAVISSVQAGDVLWIPMRNHIAMRLSLTFMFPFNIIAILVTLFIWGPLEGIFFITIVKKLDDIIGKHVRNPYFSTGTILFALWNPLLHIAIRLFEQRFTGIDVFDLFLSFSQAYAMITIYKVTKNSSGTMFMQMILNGLGKL